MLRRPRNPTPVATQADGAVFLIYAGELNHIRNGRTLMFTVLGAAFLDSAFRDWKGKPMCSQQLRINDARLHMAMNVAQIGTFDWNIRRARFTGRRTVNR